MEWALFSLLLNKLELKLELFLWLILYLYYNLLSFLLYFNFLDKYLLYNFNWFDYFNRFFYINYLLNYLLNFFNYFFIQNYGFLFDMMLLYYFWNPNYMILNVWEKLVLHLLYQDCFYDLDLDYFFLFYNYSLEDLASNWHLFDHLTYDLDCNWRKLFLQINNFVFYNFYGFLN
jgi:hypothetical protein